MYEDDMPDIPNLHFYEADVVRHQPYVDTVEMAMMAVAFEVIEEEPSRRTELARAVIFQSEDRTRFSHSFAIWALRHDDIRLAVFAGPGDYRPELIKGEALRTLIRAGWDFAANMQPEQEE